MRKTVVAVVAAVAIVLSGCGGPPPAEPTPTAPSSASPTPSATPTPTPTPTPTIDMSDPANWIIGLGAVGPISLGQPIDVAIAAASGYVEGESYPDCPVVFLDRASYPSLAIPYWPDDLATRIIVRQVGGAESPSATPRTVTGIGVGSTTAEILAAYPEASVIVDHAPSFVVYSVSDGGSAFINIAVTDDIVTSLDLSPTATFGFELC